jgi:hypothetical protein
VWLSLAFLNDHGFTLPEDGFKAIPYRNDIATIYRSGLRFLGFHFGGVAWSSEGFFQMTRKELINAVQRQIGCKPSNALIAYARQRGIIEVHPQQRLGWLDYRQDSVERLVEYCQTRSRVFASQASK